MRTRRNFRNSRTRRAKRALRRLNEPPSSRTLKSLKNLTYRDLKALSSKQLQEYKRRLHIVDQEGNPYTDEELRKKLRPYISKQQTLKRGGGKKKVIEGKGKITFHKAADAEKMRKKYPDVQFEKMNQLTFTTTYKGNKEYDLKIQVGDTVIPCSYRAFAEPWKYGSKLQLKIHFNDLGKKAYFSISGGIQHALFKFFRRGWGYENNMKNDRTKRGGGKYVYLIFHEGSSDKFWSATKDGSEITTTWGRIGTAGSSTTKDYGSDVDKEYDKLIKSKKKKGYVEAKESKTGSKTKSKSESKKTLRKELDCKKFTRYHKGKGNRLQWPPVMMGIPAGKGQAYKYLGKYNQFTDEPVPVKKGLVAERVKNPDDDAWGQYCGDRRPASKADMPVHPGSQKYFIHDNGGRPFLVYVAGNKVWIYKHSKEIIVEDQKDFDNPKYYTELVKEYTAKQVFIGKSPKNEMTKYSGGHGPKFTGNSILLKIGDKRYVSIGWTIYEFSTKDEITEYHSPVGNNDVPYPVAIGTDYVYFMIEDVYVAKELFEDFPKKYKWHDHAYAKLWGQEPFTEQNKSNMKKHRQKMMNVKMVHKRTQ